MSRRWHDSVEALRHFHVRGVKRIIIGMELYTMSCYSRKPYLIGDYNSTERSYGLPSHSFLENLVFATPVLSDLHWLPVRHRIDFKIATITFKVPYSSSSHPTSPLLFLGICRHDLCDLLPHCHYVFLIEKRQWQSPNHFHLSPQVFGIISRVIFHPFPLFPLPGRDSSTIYFRVPFPVIPHHPLASRFAMSVHPQTQLRSGTPHRLANTFQLSAYD